MTHEPDDLFDDDTLVALAASALGPEPSAAVRRRLLSQVERSAAPAGFSLNFAASARWVPHPVPGIRMRVLAENRAGGYATVILDVQPGTRFPTHHHGGAEECYVIAGDVHTCGRVLGPGDFVHADADTDHEELFTEGGCQVLIVAPPEECGLPA